MEIENAKYSGLHKILILGWHKMLSQSEIAYQKGYIRDQKKLSVSFCAVPHKLWRKPGIVYAWEIHWTMSGLSHINDIS